MATISIVIPTYNEAANITRLIERIDQAFYLHQIPYEIIVVDDHSTDSTISQLNALREIYPIRLISKKGKKGRAFSVLEGIEMAESDYVGVIDADLQYPPETLPFMLAKCLDGSDIVVAHREPVEYPMLKWLPSQLYQKLYGRFMHGLTVDVQSGMKVFKKDIVNQLDLNPTAWTFGLEFLAKAKTAGFTIDEYDVAFTKRKRGKAEKSNIKRALDLAVATVSLKLRPTDIFHFGKKERLEKGEGFTYKGEEFIHYSVLPLQQTAFFQLDRKQKTFLTLLLSILFASFMIDWHLSLIILLSIATVFYAGDVLFNLYLVVTSLYSKTDNLIEKSELSLLQDESLPTYTILCPLYKEGAVLPQFLKAITALDYPKDKMQVLLLLEEDDTETISLANKLILPAFVSLEIVPTSQPKTKPKACNLGLKKATGDYIVVYDAEDMPEKDQLKKAVLAFQKLPTNTICVQAKLSFYNDTQNILTRLFTAEYALWFDVILPGLQRLHAPIPLGGTSNHFKTVLLKELGGWDAFNVTEDCDLGMRLAKHGFTTAILDSTTYEEANSKLFNWINQRSRWIKGYIQTFLVHLRSGRQGAHPVMYSFFLLFVVGGKVASLLLNPLMWMLTLAYFLFTPVTSDFIHSLFPQTILYLGVFSLVFGNFLYLYYYMLGLTKREKYGLTKFTYLIPFYWLLMSLAAVKGVVQMITKPHYWAKTTHGLHLAKENHEVKQKWSLPIRRIDIPYIPILATNL